MEKLVKVLGKVPVLQIRNDDDFSDRLSHRYTTIILVLFAVLLSMRQWVGKPITCWAPKHFTGNHIKYANSYCWVKNTYFLPLEEEIPKEHEEEKRHELLYYQWLPFVFLGMAIFFYLPRVIWKGLNQKGGVDCDDIMASAEKYQKAVASKDKKDQDKIITFIRKQVCRFLQNRRFITETGAVAKVKMCLSTVCCCFGKRMGNYLVILYIFSKLCYIANVLGQLYILNALLKTNFSLYGQEVINDIIQDKGWTNSSTFPKITMCDFKIRRLGNLHRYSLQCVLPVNLYAEKMFAFLWFWMVAVALVTCLSTVAWIIRSAIPRDRWRYIRNHLFSKEGLKKEPSDDSCRMFVQNYLGQDGVFILRLIGHNTCNITVTEITSAVWNYYVENPPKPPRANGHPEKPLIPTTEKSDSNV